MPKANTVDLASGHLPRYRRTDWTSPPGARLLSSSFPSANRTMTTSVIIPYFNASRTIRRTLDSVYRQSLPADEIIVVDDGSATREADRLVDLQNYFGFRLIRKENGGVSSARNTGARAAKGNLLAFLDSDDVWNPDYLATLIPYFDDPATGLVFAQLEWIDEDDRTMGVTNKLVPHPSLEKLLLGNFVGSGSNFIVRRDCFQSIGGFDNSPLGAEDYLLAIRLFLAGEWDAIQAPEPLVQYRRSRHSKSRKTMAMLHSLHWIYRETNNRLTVRQRMIFRFGILKMIVALNTVELRLILGKTLRHFKTIRTSR